MAAPPKPQVRSTPLTDAELASIFPREGPQPADDFDPEPPEHAPEEPPEWLDGGPVEEEEPTSRDGIEYGPETDPRKRGVDIGSFAKFPNKFFGSGMARKIGPSASVLYLALCENANRSRERSNSFRARDKDLAWETGLSPRTIRNVRAKLLENGLAHFRREPGQNYTYTLTRQDLKWFKPAERPPRQKQRPRGMAAQRAERQP